jgi:diaminopimelate epimerase
MTFNLAKLHSSGNSFLVCFIEDLKIPADVIARLCDPRFGLGGDGMVMIRADEQPGSYRLSYFNNNGSEFKMCFNGTICAALFLKHRLQSEEPLMLCAPNFGEMQASFSNGTVSVDFTLPSIRSVISEIGLRYLFGTCHSVFLTDNHKIFFAGQTFFDSPSFVAQATVLRAEDELFPEGANVHFISVEKDKVYIRHFEKGVEAETLSCGSGCVAAAFVLEDKNELEFISPGGRLRLQKSPHYWTISGQPELIAWLSAAGNTGHYTHSIMV